MVPICDALASNRKVARQFLQPEGAQYRGAKEITTSKGQMYEFPTAASFRVLAMGFLVLSQSRR
jgi:hypothetical protein